MKNSLKYTALASTILLTAAFAGPAQAAKPESETKSLPIVAPYVPISAPNTATLTFEKTLVKSTPAPVVENLAPAVVHINPVPTPTTNTQSAPASAAPAPAAIQSAPPVASPVAASGKGASLLASAYSQIGINQDCTRMVENALASVGIISGDLAPAQFFQFGSVVGTPAPGDIIISAGHVGIYAGNGQMISGGFNGNQTVLHPISYVGGYSAVRVA